MNEEEGDVWEMSWGHLGWNFSWPDQEMEETPSCSRKAKTATAQCMASGRLVL